MIRGGGSRVVYQERLRSQVHGPSQAPRIMQKGGEPADPTQQGDLDPARSPWHSDNSSPQKVLQQLSS